MSRRRKNNRYQYRQAPNDVFRFKPTSRRALSGPALRIFVAIADLWKLSELERRLVLGYPSRATYYLWCKRARDRGPLTLGIDVLSRVAAMLAIQQALEVRFPNLRVGIDWLHTNRDVPVLGGLTPLARITSGLFEDLLAVRQFLDNELSDRPRPHNRIGDALIGLIGEERIPDLEAY